MQLDVWYDLVLRDLSGPDETVRERLKDAETAQGAPDGIADDAEADTER